MAISTGAAPLAQALRRWVCSVVERVVRREVVGLEPTPDALFEAADA
jgi:hypothetical protein